MGGTLNLPRFEQFLSALAEMELDRFEEIYSDAKWIEGKTAKRLQGGKNKVFTDTPGPAHVGELLGIEDAQEGWEIVSHQQKKGKDTDLLKLLQSANDFLMESSSEPTDPDENSENEDLECFQRGKTYDIEFRQHKREYYIHKLGYENVTAEVLREQAEGYVLAIQWNLHYYYDGCVSWAWYYQHHYAPWITDIQGFSNMSLTLEKGEPFLPFEQLLSVLPSASKDLLPPALQSLMINPDSPIFEFYPKDFVSDLNGKQQEWEAVVLIPFIEEIKLKEAIQPLFARLTTEEKSRNKHGPMMAYTFSKESLGTYHAPQYFPIIERNFATGQEIWRKEWEVPIDQLQKGLMPSVRLDVYFPGFPTLKHIKHKAKLGREAVKVFEQASRGENMMLEIINEDSNLPLDQIAEEYIGKDIWVSWPHMVEARVHKVRNDRFTFEVGKSNGYQTDQDEFRQQAHVLTEHYKNRYGIIPGDVQILISAKVICGRQVRLFNLQIVPITYIQSTS